MSPGRCKRFHEKASLGIDLVFEVIASAAEKKVANTALVRVASSRPDARLRGDQFERSLEVVGEGKRDCRAIGAPPR
jgi:hypothetical protein